MLGLGTGINKLSAAEAASISARNAGSYLLDDYSGAAAAYSLRQLSSTYSGSSVKVRRASDNVEADIGFASGELDTAALASHCGASDGFVSVWYDQANSNNATQATAANQPKIYDGTTGVVTQGGKPTLKRNASGSIYMNTPSFGSTSSTASIFTVVNPRTNRSIIYQSGGYIASEGNGALSIYYGSFISGTASTIKQRIQTYLIGSTDYGYIDGTLNVSGDAGSSLIGGASNIGGQSPNFRDPEEMQEIIIYLNDQSSNRTGIEDNINTFYSIY